MRTLIIAIFSIVGSACFSFAQESETKQFTSAYNVSISTPKDWVWDSEAVRDAKVAFTEIMFKIRTDGKIRLLNTGTAPASADGYARIRLSITSNAQFSQKELRDATEDELLKLTTAAREELVSAPGLTVSKDSIAVTKTRADTDYWAYRISYTRNGVNGQVRVEQYYVPFSDRAVSLTFSYELAHKEKLAPLLLRVWSSLDLNDATLWPAEK